MLELEQEIHGICDFEIQSGERVFCFCLVAEKVRQEKVRGNAQFNISSGVATVKYEFFFLSFFNKNFFKSFT